ncbi:MAG: peptidyl-tRNA hydrolase [Candidatus Aenigmarchaeota archaeon]|nr:peptidyl-tRNA hydrolase [Candidatus Aenigmarchaeota archaeon]
MYKQVIVVRTDLGMSSGKIAAQVAHASIQAWKNSRDTARKTWEREGSKKVVLGIGSEEMLLAVHEKAKKAHLPAALVKDAGATEVAPGTLTCVAIGPAAEEDVDKITRHLPLLD